MSATVKSPFNPNYAVAPGTILAEWLEERGMSQSELSDRMGRPKKTINEIIKGKAAVTPETACQLEAVTGVEASFWTNAERLFRERAARLAEEERLLSWLSWSRQFPVARLARLGWMEPATDRSGQVRALLRWLGVASPEAWEAVYVQAQTAYRKSPTFAADPIHLGAWLRQGELQAAGIECSPFTEVAFCSGLSEIRHLTAEPFDRVRGGLVDRCRGAGVALVFVPELPKTHVSGATRWLAQSKALIQLSLRYKTDDQLWFTFFHEAAHLLLHGKKEVIVETGDSDDPQEREANQWAEDFLIPPADWKAFVESRRWKASDIQAFAGRLGIAPGIVVGRLQHGNHIPFSSGNHLKRPVHFGPVLGSNSNA